MIPLETVGLFLPLGKDRMRMCEKGNIQPWGWTKDDTIHNPRVLTSLRKTQSCAKAKKGRALGKSLTEIPQAL